MSTIEEIRERNETALDAAKELGRGLMRGNKEELKLGYSFENATFAAAKMFLPSPAPDIDMLELKIHLLAFGAGMTDGITEEQFQEMRTRAAGQSSHLESSFNDGFRRGQDEPYAEIYPAGLKTAEEDQEERDRAAVTMNTCGCGATKPSECTAAVEGYFTSLGQRSEVELHQLAEGDGCEAARVLLVKRAFDARDS